MSIFENILKERILILDGATGTMIQQFNLQEEDYRGSRFRDLPGQMKGNNDILSLTRPDIIQSIHESYLEAGADIIETNTFNANAISMADYGMESFVCEMNLESVSLAKKAAEKYTQLNPQKPRFVAGSIGPTNKSASISPNISDPAFRNVSFDELYSAYLAQAQALIEGKVDALLIETVFDTLNAKAALLAAQHAMKALNVEIPLMLSFTIAGKSGRILSGQTLEAALASVAHIDLVSVGLNCSFGAEDMKPFLKELSRIAPCYVSAYPNAGLPNSLGQYDETPAIMAGKVRDFVDEKLVNILGGCCGTTPAHIAEYARIVDAAEPRKPVLSQPQLTLSGLDALSIGASDTQAHFVVIGERCNVAGSRKFLRLIKEKKYDEALDIARKQVEDGAFVLDLNVDDGLLDGVAEMTTFLNLLASEPDIARVPVMIDSSDWNVIEAGLKVLQGKSIVNSISLKNGEADFLDKAGKIKSYGAAVIAMAFDEKGQADTFDRKIEVCARMYRLLTEKAGFPPSDIIFDPNVLAIATGIESHNTYAQDFIRATGWIKQNLPEAKVSGGVSNLSFSFRGNNYLREAMHSIFLYHCIREGLDMGIVNPSVALNYDEIPASLTALIEDVLFNSYPEAVEKLTEYAQNSLEQSLKKEISSDNIQNLPVEERLKNALIKGNDESLETNLLEALKLYPQPMDIIDQILMDGMNTVGRLFGEGKMFLPQVVKTARTMKKAVSFLQPLIEEARQNNTVKAGKILIATVKGDVHDIGKNITGVILSCNNYEVIDIGVMVPPEEIIAKANEFQVDMIALSGLITPSLQEMAFVASEMEKAGLTMPLMIGGATTSQLHTALKIDPLYHGPVVHVPDASLAVPAVNKLLNPSFRDEYVDGVKRAYDKLRTENAGEKELVSLEYARQHPYVAGDYSPVKPCMEGCEIIHSIDINELIPYINWAAFLAAWRLPVKYAHYFDHNLETDRKSWMDAFSPEEKPKMEEAVQLLQNAYNKLVHWIEQKSLPINAAVGFFPLKRIPEGICVEGKDIYFLRQQEKNEKDVYCSLADFFTEDDFIGFFTVTVGEEPTCACGHCDDSYNSILNQTLRDRLVEAASEFLHREARTEYWGYASGEDYLLGKLQNIPYSGIRPAAGYPIHPDISLNFLIDEFLDMSKIGVTLTPNGAFFPTSTIAGMYIAHPDSHYFRIGKIGDDQLAAFAEKRGFSDELLRKYLGSS